MASVRCVTALALALAVFGCAAPAIESEQKIRQRLHAAHEATLRIELRGQLDAAAQARGVAAVACWWNLDDAAVLGAVDASGVVRVRVPAIEFHASHAAILHLIDRAGGHWYCAIDPAPVPPTGLFDLGELRLAREPASPVVVGDRGRVLAGTRILFEFGEPTSRVFETVTDASGRAPLCRALPIDLPVRVVARHQDFAPWCGGFTDRIELDHGTDVRGRAFLPASLDRTAVMATAWIESAVVRGVSSTPYAEVRAPIARDGSYHLRNVPRGTHKFHLVDRLSGVWLGPSVDVEVASAGAVAPDLALYGGPQTCVPMRLDLVDPHDRPVCARQATIWVSDVGIGVDLRDGHLEWHCKPREPFGIGVCGYVDEPRREHHSGERIRLGGGNWVNMRLALDSSRRLPAGCALLLSVDLGSAYGVGYPDNPPERLWPTRLAIDRDARVVVAAPGRHRIGLDLVRWNDGMRKFEQVGVDVEPREFEVRAEDYVTLVTVASSFTEGPR